MPLSERSETFPPGNIYISIIIKLIIFLLHHTRFHHSSLVNFVNWDCAETNFFLRRAHDDFTSSKAHNLKDDCKRSGKIHVNISYVQKGQIYTRISAQHCSHATPREKILTITRPDFCSSKHHPNGFSNYAIPQKAPLQALRVPSIGEGANPRGNASSCSSPSLPAALCPSLSQSTSSRDRGSSRASRSRSCR